MTLNELIKKYNITLAHNGEEMVDYPALVRAIVKESLEAVEVEKNAGQKFDPFDAWQAGYCSAIEDRKDNIKEFLV